jgi:hypothetical protein
MAVATSYTFIYLLASTLPFLAVVKDFTSEVGTPVRQAGAGSTYVIAGLTLLSSSYHFRSHSYQAKINSCQKKGYGMGKIQNSYCLLFREGLKL